MNEWEQERRTHDMIYLQLQDMSEWIEDGE